MTPFKLIIATFGATILLGAFVANASAGNLSTTSQTFRAAFSAVTFRALFGSWECQITLEGSLHARTIAKVVDSLIGYITEATLGLCNTMTATILRETLPWHVRYEAFAGVLPNILRIFSRIIGFRIQFREPGFTCLATSTEEGPALLTFSRTTATGALTAAALGGVNIETTCGRNLALESGAPVTVLNSTTRVTVTLI